MIDIGLLDELTTCLVISDITNGANMWIKVVSGAMSGASFGTFVLLILLCIWGHSTQKTPTLASRLYYHSPTAIVFGFGLGGIAGSLLTLILEPTLSEMLLRLLWFRILAGISIGTTAGIIGVAFFRVHYTFIVSSEYIAPTLLEVLLFESHNLLFSGAVFGVISGAIVASELGHFLHLL